MIAVQHDLAALLRDTGNLDAAEEQGQAVLRACRRKYGDNHERTLAARNFLAHIDIRRGRYAEARRDYEHSSKAATVSCDRQPA